MGRHTPAVLRLPGSRPAQSVLFGGLCVSDVPQSAIDFPEMLTLHRHLLLSSPNSRTTAQPRPSNPDLERFALELDPHPCARPTEGFALTEM